MKENNETKHRGKRKGKDKRGKESRNNEKKIKLKQEKRKMDTHLLTYLLACLLHGAESFLGS
jgi:hypothetical protein